MNAILSMILSWQFVFLALGIAIATYVVRTIIDFYVLDNPSLPGNRNSKFWRSLVLPLLPIGFGLAFAFISNKYAFTYPTGVSTQSSQMLFCLAAGALSTVVFKVVKELLLANISNPFSSPYFPTTTFPNTNYNPVNNPININNSPIPGPINFPPNAPVNMPISNNTTIINSNVPLPSSNNGHGIDGGEPTI
jgi:hypothetical protein